MSSKGSTQVKVKWKVLGVEVELVFLQPHSSLNVDKEQPEEYCWETDPLLCMSENVVSKFELSEFLVSPVCQTYWTHT